MAVDLVMVVQLSRRGPKKAQGDANFKAGAYNDWVVELPTLEAWYTTIIIYIYI